MSDVLEQVKAIAATAGQMVDSSLPMVAAVAAQAHANTTDHESRIAKLEALITQWAPLVEASAAMVESAIAKPTPPKGA